MHIHLIATGGTIAGHEDGWLTAEDFKTQLGVEIIAEDLFTVPSSHITPGMQFKLATRINSLLAGDVDGVVVTHGTDSLEESAFMVDLLLKHDKPVVFTGAMRSPGQLSPDGLHNINNAIRLAQLPSMHRLGVLITLNDVIHAAREMRKTHSSALNAFDGDGGIGYMDEGQIYLRYHPARRYHLDVDRIETGVDLIAMSVGDDGHLVRAAVEQGAKGIVVDAFGRGNLPPRVRDAAREARAKGVVIVMTSRTRGGRIDLYPLHTEMGIITAHDLDAFKARLLLMLALTVYDDVAAIQSVFDAVAGQIQ